MSARNSGKSSAILAVLFSLAARLLNCWSHIPGFAFPLNGCSTEWKHAIAAAAEVDLVAAVSQEPGNT